MYNFIENGILEQNPSEEFEIKEKAHGRNTTWQIKTFQIEDKNLQKEWANLQQFMVINKTVISKDKSKNLITSRSVSYRITDLKDISAEKLLKGIRGHWGIENRTHWVKDAIMKEDTNGIKNINGAVNIATFNTIVINFLRQNIDQSIKTAQILFGQNVKELCVKIRT